MVFGDVSFDLKLSGTILSTEDLFQHLALELKPVQILLAGIEPGVWADYPVSSRILPEITGDNLDAIQSVVGGSAATDVTGGMSSKVQQSLEMVKAVPGLSIRIFSGAEEGEVKRALLGGYTGTLIHAS